MKLNIEVDTSGYGNISVALSQVSINQYRNLSKSDIDAAVCKVLEVAYIGDGNDRKAARFIAESICYGNSPSQSACQADTTNHSDSANADACTTHQQEPCCRTR